MKKDSIALYNELINENTGELKDVWEKSNSERKKANKIFFTIAIVVDIIAILIFLPIILNLVNEFGDGMLIYFLPLIFGVGIFDLLTYIIVYSIFSKNSREYNNIYKETVINELLKNFYTNVDYIPNRQMPREIYDGAGYKEYYDRYFSDDYMEGKIDGRYDIKMAEIHTEREERSTDSDGNTTTHYVTLFHGLFAKINLDKSINNNLIIKPNIVFSGGKTKLDMDSQEFEKYFDVYSDDKIKGMQLLTHDVMDTLLQLRKVLKNNYDIYIYNNVLYLRLDTYTMFEGKISKNELIEKTKFQRYYDILDIMNSLVHEILKSIDDVEI